MLSVRCFGSLEITLNNTPLNEITRSPTLSNLFAYLLLNRDRSHHRTVLGTLLWPETSESRSRRNLSKHLWRLRRLLEPEPEGQDVYLLRDSESVGWNPEAPLWLDVAEFETIIHPLDKAEQNRLNETEIARLEAAQDLYHGDLLEGLYADWCVPLREQMRERFILVLQALVHAHLDAERLPAALSVARRLVKVDPWTEESHALFIDVLGKMGRMGEARAHYQSFMNTWRSEFDLPPSPRMQTLAAIYQINSVAPNLPQKKPVNPAEALWTSTVPLQNKERVLFEALHSDLATNLANLGIALKERFAIQPALAYLIAALRSLAILPPAHENQQKMLSLRFEIDQIYDLQADHAAQIENLDQAWNLAEELGNVESAGQVLACKMWVYRSLGNLSLADKIRQQGLDLLESLSQDRQGLILRLSGIIAEEEGDFTSALDFHSKAFALDQSSDNSTALLADLINMAGVCMDMGRFSRALTLFSQAENRLSSTSPPLLQAILKGKFGQLLTLLGDLPRANHLINEASQIARRTGDYETVFWVTLAKGALYFAQAKYQQAQILVVQTYHRTLEPPLPRAYTLSMDLLSQLYLVRGQAKQSLEWSKKLAEQAKRCGYNHYFLRAKLHQSRALLSLGEYLDAFHWICLAKTSYENRDQPIKEAPELFHLFGECARAVGEVSQAEEADQISQAVFLSITNEIQDHDLKIQFMNNFVY